MFLWRVDAPERGEEMSDHDKKLDAALKGGAGDLLDFVRRNWLLYAGMGVTAFLTGYAAYEWTRNPLYAVVAVMLSEGAFLFWKGRIPESGNAVQKGADIAGTAISLIAIVLTDIASAIIVAVKYGGDLFTGFTAVPVWAQGVVVFVGVALAITHIILKTVFDYFSAEAEAERKERAAKADADEQIKSARRAARIAEAKAHAAEYERLAREQAAQIGRSRGAEMWRNEHADVPTYAADTASVKPPEEVNPTPRPPKD